jgi:gliding motility-associated-like protein
VAATDSSAVFISADEGFVQQFRIKALGAEPAGVFSWSNEATATFGNVPAFYNIFTPDGDSRNETFYIDNVHLYPDNELTVYNRYGKEVFRQKRYNNTWKGEAVTAGTYYYLFKLQNGQSYKGWVEIVK